MSHPKTAYKVLTGDQMAALERDGTFAGAPVDLADGYVHLSTAGQLTETVDKHFAGQDDLHTARVTGQDHELHHLVPPAAAVAA